MTEIKSDKFRFVDKKDEFIEEGNYYNHSIKKRILKNKKFQIGMIMLIIIVLAIIICPSFSKWKITDTFKRSENMFPSKEH